MTAKMLNDAPVLDQLNGIPDGWKKMLAMVVWKMARQKGVTITTRDMQQFSDEGVVLLTHGHYDAFEFRIVTPEDAERIAAHHKATQEGRA